MLGIETFLAHFPTKDRTMSETIDPRLPGLPISYLATTERTGVDSLLVLMPAARSPKAQPGRPIYSRWTWRDAWATSHVMAFADPVMQVRPKLNGAWYMHPDHDVLSAMAQIVTEHAAERGIPQERILVYGSSLGGFGALGMAAHMNGARAYAEVPQIDFAHWIPSAIHAVQTELTGPLETYRAQHPEQVSIVDRFTKAGRVPPFTIFTNPSDTCFADQKDLVEWSQQAPLERLGRQELVIGKLMGHKVQDRDELTAALIP